MNHLLFVCSKNRLRSPTAEQVFASWPNVETDSAGLAPEAVVQLSAEQLQWATLIFVMEPRHREKLRERFAAELKGKRVICLGIPDSYAFMEPALVSLLTTKVGKYLR